MGMGYAANKIHTVAEETVEKVCGDELKKFLDEVNNADVDIDDCYTAECIDTDNQQDLECSEESANLVIESYNALIHKFRKETGLYLALCAHNSDDNGSRYDEVDGHYWEIGTVMTFTPEAKAFKEKFGEDSIIETHFVEYC